MVAALSPVLILVAVTAALLAAALANDSADGEPEAADLPELVSEMESRVARGVEQVRGLRFGSLPRSSVVSSDDLNELNAEELGKPGIRRQLLAEETAAKLLGLIDFGADLTQVAEESGDLAAAAYDPEDDRLYVVDDAVGASPALAEFVLSHELNHALEDQVFDLDDSLGSGDRALARTSLVEGTASLVMVRYARRFQNPLALALSAGGVDSGTEGVPPFIVRQLLFAYTRGAAFVRALYNEAGGWDLVNRALRSAPPVSSEQILHPEKYLAGEGPVEFAAADSEVAGTASPQASSGTLGEFTTREILGRGGRAARAAAGWGADEWRLESLEEAPGRCIEEGSCRGGHILTVQWYWDTPSDVIEFLSEIPAYLRRLGARRTSIGWSLPGQDVVLTRGGLNTTLTFAPSP